MPLEMDEEKVHETCVGQAAPEAAFQEYLRATAQEGKVLEAVCVILRTLDRKSVLKVLLATAAHHGLCKVSDALLSVMERGKLVPPAP